MVSLNLIDTILMMIHIFQDLRGVNIIIFYRVSMNSPELQMFLKVFILSSTEISKIIILNIIYLKTWSNLKNQKIPL